jgi:hypothetical protein
MDSAGRTEHFKKVQSMGGWMSDESGYFAAFLTSVQRKFKISGSIAEIGVHHGKFFSAMAVMADTREQLLAIDLFEGKQSQNIDRSGTGSSQILMRHMQNFMMNTSKLQLIAGSSLELRPNAGAFTNHSMRMFSVDGGHTKEITFHDLVRH